MNKEEQKAIEYINNIEYIDITKPDNLDKLYDSRDLILSLISKLQKELELEKEKRIFWHDKYFELKQICEDEGLKLGF